MNGSSYALAAAAGEAVVAFYAQRLGAVRARRAGSAPPVPPPVPDAATVAAIVDVAFWASLLREEGRTTRVSLAFAPPDAAGQGFRFEQPVLLAPEPLTRLGPAVEQPGVHLGVWPDGAGQLVVWGATLAIPDLCFVLEVVEPGLVVLKYRRGSEFGKFGNIAVLRGDRMRIVVDEAAHRHEGPPLLAALLGSEATAAWADDGNGLLQLAVAMRGHGRGGSLLVVPRGAAGWPESIVRPTGHLIAPAFARLGDLLRLPRAERGRAGGSLGVPRLVGAIAGLTAVDGAAVISDAYELLAFGVKIGRRDGHRAVEQVLVSEPVVGDVPTLVSPGRLGGTRHLSAAQFVHDQRDAVALVASQDGRLTVFAWSAAETMVRAYRIEALLL